MAIIDTTTPQPRPLWSEAALNGILYAATLGLVAERGWSATDLVWALWASSFSLGYLLILTIIIAGIPDGRLLTNMARRRGDTRPGAEQATTSRFPVQSPWFVMLPIALFLLAFFTFHFGMFHMVHAVFLNLFFPLFPTGSTMDPFTSFEPTLIAAFARSWPFILISAVSRYPSFLQALRSGGADMLATPYGSVARMHFLIFIMAFLHMTGNAGNALYAVLALYFVPWGGLLGKGGLLRSSREPGPPSVRD